MSMYFEAVVLAANQSALIGLLESLQELDEPDPLTPITLKLSRIDQERYVVFGWRAGAARPMCAQEMEHLTGKLSLKFGTAVAVHYDDQVGVRVAMLARDGEPVRHFGEQDEVWVPYGEDGEPCTDGPRYLGNAVPDDVECDCTWNGIDAALEMAGFRKWITARKLAAEVAYRAFREDQLWERPGVPENHRTRPCT
jgi:hypothetical protein